MRYFPSASQAVSQAIAPKNLYLKGSYAEYLRIPATGEFAALPASLDVVHAAALPMAGMTALGALDTAALAKGAVLLIVGSTGGIGSFAIQMAARLGAHVIATARTEDQERIRHIQYLQRDDLTLQRTRCIRAGRQRASPSGSSRRCGLGALRPLCPSSAPHPGPFSVVPQRQQ